MSKVTYEIECSTENPDDELILRTLSKYTSSNGRETYIKQCIKNCIRNNELASKINEVDFFPLDDIEESKLQTEDEENEYKPLDLPVADVCEDKNGENFYKNYDRYLEITGAFEKANAKPILPKDIEEKIAWLHEFRATHEAIVFKFLDNFIHVNSLIPYDQSVVNEVLEPFIPKCTYDENTGIFDMEISFVPFIKFRSPKAFILVKNTLVYLIMEGVKRMEVKPKYEKNAVLIIFTIYSPYVFDVDNVEIKYVIDALRYSEFFYDDSYKYVSILVEGDESKKHPFVKVKIVKKEDVKMPK